MHIFDWEEWKDFMEDCDHVRLPSTIIFDQGKNREFIVEKETRLATLDELSAAAIYLDKEIERLTKVRSALYEIQKRVYGRVRPGSMLVVDALGLRDNRPEPPDDFCKDWAE